jgi:hypothetical protein
VPFFPDATLVPWIREESGDLPLDQSGVRVQALGSRDESRFIASRGLAAHRDDESAVSADLYERIG